jgi:hypothetical protein
MPDRPCILDKQRVVVIDGRHNRSSRILQNRGEIRIRDIAVLAPAIGSGWCGGIVKTPKARKRRTLGVAVGRARPIANPRRGRYLHLRNIPVLINHVPQTVKLIADFEVVGPPPNRF